MKKEEIKKEINRLDLEEKSLKTDSSNAHNTGHDEVAYECTQALATLSIYRNKLNMKLLED